jgi:hypothetical protein
MDHEPRQRQPKENREKAPDDQRHINHGEFLRAQRAKRCIRIRLLFVEKQSVASRNEARYDVTSNTVTMALDTVSFLDKADGEG